MEKGKFEGRMVTFDRCGTANLNGILNSPVSRGCMGVSDPDGRDSKEFSFTWQSESTRPNANQAGSEHF